MDIAILGGTGDIGEGLALRIARDTDHNVLIGSREEDRAGTAADSYRQQLRDRGADVDIVGMTNREATKRGSLVILAVPPWHIADTVESTKAGLDLNTVLISPAVGMRREEDGFNYAPPENGSVAQLVADVAPESVPVVGAFHNLAAGALRDLDRTLGMDVIVVGDNRMAKRQVVALVESLEGLRPLNGGGLTNSSSVEAITPLLLNLSSQNEGMHDLGVSFL